MRKKVDFLLSLSALRNLLFFELFRCFLLHFRIICLWDEKWKHALRLLVDLSKTKTLQIYCTKIYDGRRQLSGRVSASNCKVAWSIHGPWVNRCSARWPRVFTSTTRKEAYAVPRAAKFRHQNKNMHIYDMAKNNTMQARSTWLQKWYYLHKAAAKNAIAMNYANFDTWTVYCIQREQILEKTKHPAARTNKWLVFTLLMNAYIHNANNFLKVMIFCNMI